MVGKNLFQVPLKQDCPNIIHLLLYELLLKSYGISDISYHKNEFVFSVDHDLILLQPDCATAILLLPSQLNVEQGRFRSERLKHFR